MNIRLLRRVANWIDFAVSILAAAFIIAVLVQLWRGALHGPEHALLRSYRLTITAAGCTLSAVLLLGAILRAVQIVTSDSERRYLTFETPSGSVAIRASSVEQAINRAVGAMGEVADASVTVLLPRGAKVPSEARVRCRLYDRPNLLAIQDQVRATVSDRYLDMFPGQEPIPVRVSVERIVFETPGPKALPASEARPVAAGEGVDEQPFRPQYPVSD